MVESFYSIANPKCVDGIIPVFRADKESRWLVENGTADMGSLVPEQGCPNARAQ